MKKVLVSDTLSPEGIEIFRNTPGIEVDVMTSLTPDELKAVIKDYDGLAVRSASKITADVIAGADKLAVIGRAGIGLDNVDAGAASKRGIVVMNTPGGNTITTAEHAIAMLLSLARKIPQATISMKAEKWQKNAFMGAEVYNKTLGIIGIGRVGSIVANRAQGLKMHVIAYDPFISPEAAEKAGIHLHSLDEVLAKSDFISIHTPLTDDTRGIINTAAFEKMKPGVYIINCARGGIVVEEDLYQALVSGKVAGAALDVFEEEPSKNYKLMKHESVICTPHLGASTDEAQRNVAIAIAQQIADYLTKGEIRNAVNFPSVSAEVLALLRPHLVLAEKMGRLQSQTLTGGTRKIEIQYSGEILDYDVAPVTIAFVKGFLAPILKETVNFINAPIIARERGIRVIESRSTEIRDYTTMISSRITTTEEESLVEGSIFGKQDPRIVRINEFTLDVMPEGHMILLYNYDKPGVIGNIGLILGNSGINIARLNLSRELIDQKALVVLSTDSPADDAVLAQLKQLPNMISVTRIEM